MNPVSSYKDIIDYYRWKSNARQHIVMVFLVKPEVLSSSDSFGLLRKQRFDYLDRRSGENVQFFIPGYSQYPNSGLSKYPQSEQAIRVVTRRLGNIYYDEVDFIDFLELLETNNPRYRYSGETELLLIKYVPSKDYSKMGAFDFSDISQYNLDDIIRNTQDRHEGWHNIDCFLEKVMHQNRDSTVIDEIKYEIDKKYYELIMPETNSLPYTLQCKELFNRSYERKRDYVFISYSSKDYVFAYKLKNILEDKGINTWIAPNDIPRGASYAHIIVEAIKNAKAAFVLLSNNSSCSLWVEKEIDRAVKYLNNRIIPLNLDGVLDNNNFSNGGLEYYLCNIQCDKVNLSSMNEEELKTYIQKIVDELL